MIQDLIPPLVDGSSESFILPPVLLADFCARRETDHAGRTHVQDPPDTLPVPILLLDVDEERRQGVNPDSRNHRTVIDGTRLDGILSRRSGWVGIGCFSTPLKNKGNSVISFSPISSAAIA